MEQAINANHWVLGVDVGGTFTDLVVTTKQGKLLSTKTPSTPDQSDGVMNGINKIAGLLGVNQETFLADCPLIVHGTTVATNTLLEYDGPKVGLLTTEGFRDEIEFRRAYKESVFSVRLQAPHQIVPRRYRIGIPERLDKEGEIIQALDEQAVRDAVHRLKAEGIEAIAVCFLFSFVNPAHEIRVKEIIKEEAPDMFISLSSEVLPQIREFERVSTTIVNAYTGPTLQSYLNHLEANLQKNGFRGELFVMQSNGGVQNVEQTGKLAAGSLLSGPAGGVSAGAFIGEKSGNENIITVDMGGTSYDVSVIEELQPTITTESWISRYRVALPMMDIHTIGSGGGSIAWIDSGGALRVGPKSAGSFPGPACYGRGGTEPTITDVNVLLGYINPDNFLGGEMKLDRDLAERAIAKYIAEPLGMTTMEAALAISQIVNSDMSNAVQYVSSQRGYDPREFALMAVGGAGAIHAGRQAEDLGINTVIVPALAPVFSAFGDVAANLKMTELKTRFEDIDTLNLDDMNRDFEQMEKTAREKLGGENIVGHFETHRYIDMRYKGEVHEVTVPVRSRTKRITRLNLEATIKDFHEMHERLYAHQDAEQTIEILNLRLDLIGVREKLKMADEPFGKEDPIEAKTDERIVYFEPDPVTIPVYDGAQLTSGNLIAGPAIIEQWGTTIVVYPRQEALIDANGNCVIEVQQVRGGNQ
ncbi:hydantoinase/oxoprolinase family protein [Gracilibacillus alcaliphilus]|uniref:hydantoinase/oxoprolinase family protein n=1 Tax=Gracilibacillus alcaliphilus TaxID=1401441 RepID=UPI00195CCAED|nr:hydantoinase/oxoprolinase family protein [Gracilibacillus alcaliphilus]MBM7679251.1 N-methylhydantoinase A [Gracilibacillus alcaliphilus]